MLLDLPPSRLIEVSPIKDRVDIDGNRLGGRPGSCTVWVTPVCGSCTVWVDGFCTLSFLYRS